MSYKVLIVDDSNFFQSRLKEIINRHPQLNVVGIASNGQEAIDLTKKLKPDVISMDYEMPMMDGVTAVRAIMAENPLPIVMFSSMTYEGAKITLDALEAGAVDFMNKNFAEVSNNSAAFIARLHEKLITFAGGKAESVPEPTPQPSEPNAERIARPERSISKREPIAGRESRRQTEGHIERASAVPERPSRRAASLKGKVKLLAIGASTGGPVALADVITKLPADFPAPVLVVQHMPENFTRAFAERLNRQSALKVKEAENGDRIERGQVLVAPGGKQMLIDKNGSSVRIIDGDDRVNYRPCVDLTFAAAANVFGAQVLGVILTGMGADGTEGARILKQKGATIWSQDRDSCVVYGMPAAVAKAGLTDQVLPIADVAKSLIEAL